MEFLFDHSNEIEWNDIFSFNKRSPAFFFASSETFSFVNLMMTDTVIRAYAVTADDGGRYQSTNFAN